MIPNDFIYCKPDNFKEVSDLYQKYKNNGKIVKFYAGGSEIITMSRTSSLKADVLIDLKEIPEMQELKMDDDKLIIGACSTLSKIKTSNLFPLLRFDSWKNCRPYKSKQNYNRWKCMWWNNI